MSAVPVTGQSGSPWRGYRAPEILLGIAGFLTFVLIPIHINTLWEGLPAHPLFVHVPVVLIPVAAFGGLVLAIWPRLFAKHGIWVCAVSVVALGSLNLTIGAGDQLRADLGLEGGGFGVAGLIARHAHAASILRLFMIVFTAVFIVTVALWRHGDGARTGVSWIDGVVGLALRLLRGVALARLALALLALGALYFVWKTGDLGAQAVWAGKIHSGAGSGPGGGAPPSLFAPGG
jgi:hypothetical protein